MSGRTSIPEPGHPITHHVAGARHSAPRTEISLGARPGGNGDTPPSPRPTPGTEDPQMT